MTINFQRAFRFVLILATVAVITTPLGSQTSTLTGTAEVTDGDSLRVAGCPIRLQAIDAPEKDQWCLDASGKQVACGIDARDRLRELIGSREVSFQKNGIDKYCRTLASCSVAGEDIQGWMVREGLALAYEEYSKDYVPQQDQTKTAKRGLWSGRFVAPWDFRHYNQSAALLGTEPPSEDQKQRRLRLLAPISSDGAPSLACIIKGNVNPKNDNKVYHMPGTFFYSQTLMRRPGVRWFCSEKEAVEAGWHAAPEITPDCEKRVKPHCR